MQSTKLLFLVKMSKFWNFPISKWPSSPENDLISLELVIPMCPATFNLNLKADNKKVNLMYKMDKKCKTPNIGVF